MDATTSQGRVALISFGIVLVLAWFCYQQGLSGAFLLDDSANLAGLELVDDAKSALEFTLSGTAGPLGRPIALLTFAMQAQAWEQGAYAYLRVNIAIHLINALLVALCAYQLSMLRLADRQQSTIIAAVVAGGWVLMPLLATSSLLVVQRMTTLSALFVLGGLAAYLIARRGISEKPKRALLGMSTALVAATILAALSKESGLLLPVFILALEVTVLDRPASVRTLQWRVWQFVFLIVPLLIILAYLSTWMTYPDWTVLRRDFNAGERVLTESRLLWVYLAKAVLGLPSTLGIMQDAPEISRSLLQPLTLAAGLSWLLLLSAAIVWRRRFPLLAFAVLWFLGGHLIESTVVPLELYFEHRNYLPILGPLIAITCGIVLAKTQWRRIGLAIAMTWVLLNAFFLFSFASLWGEPSLSARYWAMQYPNSVRAVTTMATVQLTEEGPYRTLQTIDDFVAEHPRHAYLRIQELNLLCQFAADQDHGDVIAQIRRELPSVDFTYTAGRMLSQLFSTSTSMNCADVTPATVASLAEVLRNNPRFVQDPAYNQFHHKLLAGIARQQGDHAATIENLRQAIDHSPSSELNMMMVTALGSAGDLVAARDFIESARMRAPSYPWHALAWSRGLDELGAYIRELERYSEGARPDPAIADAESEES